MKLARPRRPGRALAGLVIVALVSLTVRAVWVNGIFSSVTPEYPGRCTALAALPVQDMEIGLGTLFLSVADPRGPNGADGIYAMPLDGKGPPWKLAGTPKDFHPRGIGLFTTPDGKGLFLMAVDRHASGRFSIDTFEVKDPTLFLVTPAPGMTPSLVAQSTIEGGLLTNPQDVAAVGPASFYVANGTASKYAPIHWLQTYGIIPGGDVLYFNGMSFREVTDGLYGARSLVLADNGNRLAVGGLLSRSLTLFRREPYAGTLTEDKVITLPAGPERLSLDVGGAVWIASHANLPDWRATLTDPSRRTASQVLRVPIDADKSDVRQIYGNDGREISGAGVAVAAGKRLFLGSAPQGRFTACSLD